MKHFNRLFQYFINNVSSGWSCHMSDREQLSYLLWRDEVGEAVRHWKDTKRMI